MNIFEKASKLKLRFTINGTISVEDLWDLPLTSRSGVDLNTLAQSIYAKLRTAEVPDFVGNGGTSTTTTDELNQLRLDLVKHVIAHKREASQANEAAAARLSEVNRLDALIAEKRDAETRMLSIEELEKKRAALTAGS